MTDTHIIGGQAASKRACIPPEDRKLLRGLLGRFIRYSEDEVLKQFESLKGSHKHKQFVYVPGARSKRILLVAHADVAREMNKRAVKWDKECDVCTLDLQNSVEWVYKQKQGWFSHGNCLGADDRAGCAALWLLRDLGHSLLVTRGEERGGIGAKAAAETLRDELSKHQFAVEVDRRGVEEFVTYGCDTDEFLAWFQEWFVGFDKSYGSFTDIARICPEICICGANLAAGFMHEHTTEEFLHLDSWYISVSKLRDMLLTAEIPRFELVKRRSQVTGGTGWYDWASEFDYGSDHKYHRHTDGAYCWRTDCKEARLPTGGIYSSNWHKHDTGVWCNAVDCLKQTPQTSYSKRAYTEEDHVAERMKKQYSAASLCCRYGCLEESQIYGMCLGCAEEFMSSDPTVKAAIERYKQHQQAQRDLLEAELPVSDPPSDSSWTETERNLEASAPPFGERHDLKYHQREDTCFIMRGEPALWLRAPVDEQLDLQRMACKACGSVKWEWADLGSDPDFQACSECDQHSVCQELVEDDGNLCPKCGDMLLYDVDTGALECITCAEAEELSRALEELEHCSSNRSQARAQLLKRKKKDPKKFSRRMRKVLTGRG